MKRIEKWKTQSSFKEAIYKLWFSLFLLANNVITIIIAIYLAARENHFQFEIISYHHHPYTLLEAVEHEKSIQLIT